jgi:SAM-dependent methyltransferase
MVSDAVNTALLRRWLSPDPSGSVLKTDLFDEVTGNGLVPWLSTSFADVTGIDISPALVQMARERFPRIHAEPADVRSLPYSDETFDVVVSNSTLDHLATAADIGCAVQELFRVMTRGGTLVITLDNPVNPVVALRNALPERVRTASRMVPFAVGATLGPRRLTMLLQRTGFEVEKVATVFHCPRLLAVAGGALVDRHAGLRAKRRYVAACAALETLRFLPTRFLTGYFVAARARRP